MSNFFSPTRVRRSPLSPSHPLHESLFPERTGATAETAQVEDMARNLFKNFATRLQGKSLAPGDIVRMHQVDATDTQGLAVIELASKIANRAGYRCHIENATRYTHAGPFGSSSHPVPVKRLMLAHPQQKTPPL